jgi:hypothetical protein
MTKHICGQCIKTFSSELSYLKHLCPASDTIPREPESASAKPKAASSLLEKKILAAVQTARQAKKQYNA